MNLFGWIRKRFTRRTPQPQMRIVLVCECGKQMKGRYCTRCGRLDGTGMAPQIGQPELYQHQFFPPKASFEKQYGHLLLSGGTSAARLELTVN